MRDLTLDPNTTGIAREGFALIKTQRLDRKRYPAGCVTPMSHAEGALAAADPGRQLHAARVYGPSPSSEGVRVYYLLHWL
jgi:hypothetical protein